MNKNKTLIIDVSKWRSGEKGIEPTGKGCTALCNSEGYKCCLGFYCEQLGGCATEEILRVYNPADLRKPVKLLTHLKGRMGVLENTKFCEEAMDINDGVDSTLEERKANLKKLFARKGIEVKFINEPE